MLLTESSCVNNWLPKIGSFDRSTSATGSKRPGCHLIGIYLYSVVYLENFVLSKGREGWGGGAGERGKRAEQQEERERK